MKRFHGFFSIVILRSYEYFMGNYCFVSCFFHFFHFLFMFYIYVFLNFYSFKILNSK
jgi:hypothetical protein